MRRTHFFVSGKVQGVCYREYSARKANLLGLKGFVKNVWDGKVEIIVEGEDEKVDEFIIFCRHNPGYSEVESLEIKEEKEIKTHCFSSFRIAE